MSADCQPQGNILLIRISGHFDYSLRPRLQTAAAAEVTGLIILDLAAVTYLDASALTLIRQLANQLHADYQAGHLCSDSRLKLWSQAEIEMPSDADQQVISLWLAVSLIWLRSPIWMPRH